VLDCNYIADKVQMSSLVTEVYDDSGTMSINPHDWVATRNFDSESTHTVPDQARVAIATRNVDSIRTVRVADFGTRRGLDISASIGRPVPTRPDDVFDVDDSWSGLCMLDQEIMITQSPLRPGLQSPFIPGAPATHNVDTRPRCK